MGAPKSGKTYETPSFPSKVRKGCKEVPPARATEGGELVKWDGGLAN